jgi:hypothetical protein
MGARPENLQCLNPVALEERQVLITTFIMGEIRAQVKCLDTLKGEVVLLMDIDFLKFS